MEQPQIKPFHNGSLLERIGPNGVASSAGTLESRRIIQPLPAVTCWGIEIPVRYGILPKGTPRLGWGIHVPWEPGASGVGSQRDIHSWIRGVEYGAVPSGGGIGWETRWGGTYTFHFVWFLKYGEGGVPLP